MCQQSDEPNDLPVSPAYSRRPAVGPNPIFDNGMKPPDGTRDGDGTWLHGKWFPDNHSGECQAENASRLARGELPTCICTEEYERMRRTHHEPGSPEEHYSRQMRFDKYLAMQKLLVNLAHFPFPEDPRPVFDQFQKEAAEVLRGMVRPRGPAARAKDRATELETLVLAYHLASGVYPVESPHLPEARTLITEALKAWERAHPPQPLDPYLLGGGT